MTDNLVLAEFEKKIRHLEAENAALRAEVEELEKELELIQSAPKMKRRQKWDED
jgi:cell division protein FtsB